MSDLEARIAEVLMAPKQHHQGSPLSYMSKWQADHQAADLAPLIREAQAEAWGDGALAAYQSMVHGDTSTNPYKEES